MANKQDGSPQSPAYCWNCGAFNATDSGAVRVNYRRRGSSGIRPHCTACAHITRSVSNLLSIIGLAVVLLISVAYILNNWNYY